MDKVKFVSPTSEGRGDGESSLVNATAKVVVNNKNHHQKQQ